MYPVFMENLSTMLSRVILRVRLKTAAAIASVPIDNRRNICGRNGTAPIHRKHPTTQSTNENSYNNRALKLKSKAYSNIVRPMMNSLTK